MAEPFAYAHWDDLTEGAGRELTVGPLTRTDFVRFAGANGDFNPSSWAMRPRIHHSSRRSPRGSNTFSVN